MGLSPHSHRGTREPAFTSMYVHTHIRISNFEFYLKSDTLGLKNKRQEVWLLVEKTQTSQNCQEPPSPLQGCSREEDDSPVTDPSPKLCSHAKQLHPPSAQGSVAAVKFQPCCQLMATAYLREINNKLSQILLFLSSSTEPGDHIPAENTRETGCRVPQSLSAGQYSAVAINRPQPGDPFSTQSDSDQ